MHQVDQLLRRPLFGLVFLLVCLFASLPPFNWWPLSFVAFVPLFAAIYRQKESNKIPWWYPFLAGLIYWAVLNSVYFVSAPFGWVKIYPMLTVLIAVSLFFLAGCGFGLVWLVYVRLVGKYAEPSNLWSLVAASFFWVLLEMALSWMFWNLTLGLTIGYSLPATTWFGQLSSIIGIWGVSGLLVLANWFIASWVVSLKTSRSQTRVRFVVFLVLWAILGAGLQWQIHHQEKTAPQVQTLAIQSANSNLGRPNYPALVEQAVAQQSGDRQSLIVLPEVAETIELNSQSESNQSGLRDRYATTIKQTTNLLVGTKYLRADGYLNGAELVSTDPSADQRTYKEHLMPFGEYLPLASLWPFQISNAYEIELTAKTQGLRASFGKLAVIFCNELFQPMLAAERVRHGEIFMVGLAKDTYIATSWWADWQLRVAGYRTVETRRSLIMATDHARSAAIGPDGQIIALAPYNQTLIVAASLPRMNQQTLWPIIAPFRWPLCLLGLLLSFLLARSSRTSRSPLLE